MFLYILFAATFSGRVASAETNNTNPLIPSNKTFGELYEIGKNSYLANDWRACVDYFEAAISAHRIYMNISLNCQQNCKIVANENRSLISADQYDAEDEELEFYERKVKSTLCLMKCKKANLGIHRDSEFVRKDIVDSFDAMEHYNFLQLCYHQLDKPDDALKAAFTYYIYHLDDKVAKTNVEYYLGTTGEKVESVVNRESHVHTTLFYQGKELYEAGEWSKTIEEMEAALTAFHDSEDRCRLKCEKPFDQGWFPDFVSSIANHFTYCLKCKLQCEERLSNLDGDEEENFVGLLYNYLQFSYYKGNDIENAAKCVASYLLYHPDDKTMLTNKKFYLDNLKVVESTFQPHPKAVSRHRRNRHEKDLFDFIEANFIFDDTDKKPKKPTTSSHSGDEKQEL